jgi:hypothetical protein
LSEVRVVCVAQNSPATLRYPLQANVSPGDWEPSAMLVLTVLRVRGLTNMSAGFKEAKILRNVPRPLCLSAVVHPEKETTPIRLLSLQCYHYVTTTNPEQISQYWAGPSLNSLTFSAFSILVKLWMGVAGAKEPRSI